MIVLFSAAEREQQLLLSHDSEHGFSYLRDETRHSETQCCSTAQTELTSSLWFYSDMKSPAHSERCRVRELKPQEPEDSKTHGVWNLKN